MVRRSRLIAVLWLLPTVLLFPVPAASQTATPAVTASGQPNPDRVVGGVVQGTRPSNLNPLGVSYSDCTSNMVLVFHVSVSGFAGQNLSVWATRSGDCTSDLARGVGASAATCWLVAQGFTAQTYLTPTTLDLSVRVQDLVGPQNAPPLGTLVTEGPTACNAQTTFAAVPMDIFFLPTDSANHYISGAYDYKIATDLVGPPAPLGVSTQAGDTFLIANWTANTDTDTAGYDLYIDPLPGHEEAGSSNGTTTETFCPDATASSTVTTTMDGGGDADDGTGSDAADGAVSDADDGAVSDADDGSSASGGSAGTTTSSADACTTITVAGTNMPSSSMCTSTLITSASASDAAATSTDDAGNLIVATGAFGISTVPCQNIVGAGCGTGLTVSDKAANTYTIKGLLNGTSSLNNYNLTISAVDGFGNIGPPSGEVCDYPAAVNDFWNLYRQDGGKGGGGLCALEAAGERIPSTVGITMLVGVATIFVRRRRARRNHGARTGGNAS